MKDVADAKKTIEDRKIDIAVYNEKIRNHKRSILEDMQKYNAYLKNLSEEDQQKYLRNIDQ